MENVSGAPSPDRNSADHRYHQIIGSSAALKSVLSQVELVAPTDSTVLVLGETGTGKELVARAIHNTSARSGRPFVKLNCAAIPFDLLESELFGHERGAFTGAIAQKIGRFEMADTGTLFLDEIGDIPLALQPKLLRLLQEQEFERLGSGRTHCANVRLVAATHRNLTEMVRRNEFRSDLYYRLNVFPVVLPPLRDRREDVAELVSHFVDVFSRQMGKQVDDVPEETLTAFTSYSWPGNVRELQNLIQRAVIQSKNGVLSNPLPISTSNLAMGVSKEGILRNSERVLILQNLQIADWVVARAAVRLGLKRTTLIAKMKKLGISRPGRQSEIILFGGLEEQAVMATG